MSYAKPKPFFGGQAMALTQVRDQMDKYSLATALEHLNKVAAEDGSMRNLLQRDRSLQEVCAGLLAAVGPIAKVQAIVHLACFGFSALSVS